ncbi:centrosomal protein 15 isoform X2 [Heterodontus francisci]|uniref:centrosomal protein 15 isoform X2 n=1 Tax=Heterodontus francisci TaxID=7792 RepID=UPI00355BB929
MKMSYLAHEVELSKRHEEILSLRTALLQQMEDQLECQMNEKKLQAVEFELANERNTSLLKANESPDLPGLAPIRKVMASPAPTQPFPRGYPGIPLPISIFMMLGGQGQPDFSGGCQPAVPVDEAWRLKYLACFLMQRLSF